MTQEEKEEIASAIDNEGFDYYFTSYGADERLKKLIGPRIETYDIARQALIDALQDLGIEIER